MDLLHFVTGDATKPQGTGTRIIVHCVNDIGVWGAGFVLALSKQFPEAKEAYLRWARGVDGPPWELGRVQYVTVERNGESSIIVANLMGQRGIGVRANGMPPIRHAAIATGLQSVARKALVEKASVHMPRIGCGLAGGTWTNIEGIILRELCAVGVDVTVYDLPLAT